MPSLVAGTLARSVRLVWAGADGLAADSRLVPANPRVAAWAGALRSQAADRS